MRVMNFTENFKKLRGVNGLTQEEMAEKIGVSRQMVSHWESGRNMPDYPTLTIICNEFNMTSDELLYKDGESNIQDNEEKLSIILKEIESLKAGLKTHNLYDMYKASECRVLDEQIAEIDFCDYGDVERQKGNYNKALDMYDTAAMYGDINGVISAIDLWREILELCEEDMSIYYSELSSFARKLIEYGSILTDVLRRGDLI